MTWSCHGRSARWITWIGIGLEVRRERRTGTFVGLTVADSGRDGQVEHRHRHPSTRGVLQRLDAWRDPPTVQDLTYRLAAA